jgi:hypothetical protein
MALIFTYRREASSVEESIERFIEEQAFLLSYDLAPPPPTPPPHLPTASRLPVCHQSGLLWGGGGGAKSYVRRRESLLVLNKSFSTLSALLSDVLKGVGTGQPGEDVLYMLHMLVRTVM